MITSRRRHVSLSLLGGDGNPDEPSGFKLYPLTLQLSDRNLLFQAGVERGIGIGEREAYGKDEVCRKMDESEVCPALVESILVQFMGRRGGSWGFFIVMRIALVLRVAKIFLAAVFPRVPWQPVYLGKRRLLTALTFISK